VTSEIRTKLQEFGTSKFVEKPLDIKMLPNMALEELNSHAQGQLHGVSTASFLQLIEMEEKSCTLTVRENGKVGYLYFLKGGLINAETAELRGESAAYEIIGWEESTLEVKGVCLKKEKEIDKPLMLILMETNRLKDEAESERTT
jgi:hypothetical protein